MNQRDRELADKIFGNEPDEPEDMFDEDDFRVEVSDAEVQQIAFAMSLLQSFYHALGDRHEQDSFFFVSPPTNFSYMMN